jgi:hypothetical protein
MRAQQLGMPAVGNHPPGENSMISGTGSIAAIGLVVILGTVGGAQAFDGPEYPDWRGQWVGFFSPKLSANGPGQAFAGWDQTKPGDLDNKRG